MATFSKQRMGRRLQLRRRNHRNHTSIYLQAESTGTKRITAERLAGAPEAFRNQINRIIQRLSATKQRGR